MRSRITVLKAACIVLLGAQCIALAQTTRDVPHSTEALQFVDLRPAVWLVSAPCNGACYECGLVQVAIGVRNHGTKPAGAFGVEVRTNFTNETIHRARLMGLAPGEQIAVGTEINLPQCFNFPQPPPMLSFIVDAGAEVGESNENNNRNGLSSIFIPLQIPGKHVPKLRVN